MTEDKRFHSEDNCVGYYTEIIDKQKKLDQTIPNPQKNLTVEELVDLLNNLYEENEDLKTDISVLNRHYDEYEKICKKLNELCVRYGFNMEKLEEENEQLRKAIDEADDLIKSHLSFYWIQKWEYYLKYLGVELK